MKRYIGLFLVLLSLTTIMSCQKEDVYNPKRRLLSIFDYQESSKTPFVSFIYDNNEKIDKAIFYDNSIFRFEYNEDHQVKKISGYSNNLPYGYVLMEYIEKKLSKVSYYNNPGTIFQIDTFYRQNGAIYGYKSYIAAVEKSMFIEEINSRLFQSYMHSHSFKNVENTISQEKGGMVLVSHTNVFYTNENITKMETVYKNGFTTLYKFTYDTKQNPLYGLPFVLCDYLKFPSSPLLSYSKNNFNYSSYTEHYGTPSTATEIYYQITYASKKYPIQIYTNVENESKLRWEFNYLK